MDLYYNIQKVNGKPTLLLARKEWYDSEKNLDDPLRPAIDNEAKEAGLNVSPEGGYVRDTSSLQNAIKALRARNHSVVANTGMAL